MPFYPGAGGTDFPQFETGGNSQGQFPGLDAFGGFDVPYDYSDTFDPLSTGTFDSYDYQPYPTLDAFGGADVPYDYGPGLPGLDLFQQYNFDETTFSDYQYLPTNVPYETNFDFYSAPPPGSARQTPYVPAPTNTRRVSPTQAVGLPQSLDFVGGFLTRLLSGTPSSQTPGRTSGPGTVNPVPDVNTPRAVDPRLTRTGFLGGGDNTMLLLIAAAGVAFFALR